MQSIKDIRRRIKSISNIQQLTRAMKMVSVARLRRAQQRILRARPYARKMTEVLNSLASRTEPALHRLLAEREEKRIGLMVVTSDKGLCGSFNSNILRKATEFLEEERGKETLLYLIGRKGRDYFRRRGYPIKEELVDIFRDISFGYATTLGREITESYSREELDSVYLLYNEFKSALRQGVVVEKLLPIQRLKIEGPVAPIDYIYEPSARVIFDQLLPLHINIQIYKVLLESATSEHAARMTAMDNATSNAMEMIDHLTLLRNKLRQAAITKELIEVVTAADALTAETEI
ncbi:ATP synthase F1 subunit gamma [bacterium (candidate division B38) B3_B38]|nr:MAG: ATP synthase F1 subunit gamma [bacterium (candidate division B38) B3_B38]